MTFDGAELAHANLMHCLDAGHQDGGATEGLEAKHRARDWFDGPMVLFDDVVEVLRLAQYQQSFDELLGKGFRLVRVSGY